MTVVDAIKNSDPALLRAFFTGMVWGAVFSAVLIGLKESIRWLVRRRR